MPQSLIKTPRDTAQALDLNGRSLLASHDQIVNILKSRLGQNHGELLAQPRIGVEGDIVWSTGLQGAVVPASQLPDTERAALHKRADRLLSDIRGLAGQLRAEGPAAQVVAQILESAVQVPAGDWLYSVGGKPVYVLWGHAAARGVVPVATVPAAPSVEVPSPQASESLPPVVPPVVPPSPPPPTAGPPWKRWLLWGLLVFLGLALLLFGLKRCAGTPDEDLSAQIAEADARNAALEAELARKRAAQMMCLPEAPPPAASAPEAPASAPEPIPPPPAASQPEPAPSAPPVRKPVKPPDPPASKPELPKAAPVPPSAPVPRSEPAPAPQRQACKPRQPGDEPEVVMVIDASGSMREPLGGMSRLDAAKRAADSMIRGLPADVDVGLVDFTACGQVRRDKFYPAAQRGALIGEINGLSPKKGTPLAQAIQRAGRVASDSADSVLVIVSDGGDSCGGDPCAAARALKAQKPNITINVIDLADTAQDRQTMQCVASAGGGRVLRPGDPLDMNRKMKEAVGNANCPP